MIMEINNGQFEFEFSHLHFIHRSNGIEFSVYFEKLPSLLLKFGEAGIIIERIKFYDKNWDNVKKYFTVYIGVIITGVSNNRVYMSALRSENHPLSNERICSEPDCPHRIDYILVMSELLKIVDEETAENIWNSDMVIIYCCWCFTNHRLRSNKGL